MIKKRGNCRACGKSICLKKIRHASIIKVYENKRDRKKTIYQLEIDRDQESKILNSFGR